MRVAAISAYVAHHRPSHRNPGRMPARQKITVPLPQPVEASRAQIAALSGRGIIVDILC